MQIIQLEDILDNQVFPWIRIVIILAGVMSLALISHLFTGGIFPTTPRENLVFQSALLLIILGSAILEPYYTKPADALVNSIISLITVIAVYSITPTIAWYALFGYCLIVLLSSITCIIFSSEDSMPKWREVISKATYKLSILLGSSKLIFSVIFLASIYLFYSAREPITFALICFWGIFLLLLHLRIPEAISSLLAKTPSKHRLIGKIIRVDNPNIIRASLSSKEAWDASQPVIGTLPNKEAFWVQPLYSQFQDDRILATGLQTELKAPTDKRSSRGISEPADNIKVPSYQKINHSLGAGDNARMTGFVVEGSEVSLIRFEVLKESPCHIGMIVWIKSQSAKVYYQIVSGKTQEESFTNARHGFQVASAIQLGILEDEVGFRKYDWLPEMNSPVFARYQDRGMQENCTIQSDFVLGVIPESNIHVGGNFSDLHNTHTAILGVTGSGKTELAFDLIRHALQSDIKVICIDLTKQYEESLSDLEPVQLSISEDVAEQLKAKLFAIETGEYGAPNEKRVLGDFSTALRTSIEASIDDFLSSTENSGLGLICLDEVANTKATLFITEIYMTCILKRARDRAAHDREKLLIAVEEAHTVMPEASTMGADGFDAKALVGKISQVALQGRKYNIGLLVLAQRTATVSKSILTQCNTIISFASYDETSLNFLKNIYGQEHIKMIPALPKLRAIAFGSWIKAEQPIVFNVPVKQGNAPEDNPADLDSREEHKVDTGNSA